MNNLQKNILNKIKTGEIDMRPRWQFVLQAVLWAAATIVVTLIAIYLLSFTLFALRETGLVFAPLFGFRGVILFIVHSPWILMSVVGIFLLALYVLVSRYSFSYQKPLVYSMIGLVLVVIAVSSFIQATNFHSRAGDFANRHGVPGFAQLYRDIDDRSSRDVTEGVVSEMNDTTFTLTTEDDESYIVELSERTRLPRGSELVDGDNVFVFGPRAENVIEAFGVRINDGQPLPPPRGERDGERPPQTPLYDDEPMNQNSTQ